ncbi:MAG: hypothetical protein K2J83_00760 [Clostridia bacterium]|nr:hypothetical protein [Clostridia bacterium]
MKNASKKPLHKIAVIAVVSSFLAFCFALTACVWDPSNYYFKIEDLD